MLQFGGLGDAGSGPYQPPLPMGTNAFMHAMQQGNVPGYNGNINAFLNQFAQFAPPAPVTHPLTNPDFLKSLADAGAAFQTNRAGILAERSLINPRAAQARVRSRHDTQYNIGQTNEDFANRGVAESGGRIQADQHQQMLGNRNIQDINQKAADDYRQLTMQLKSARLSYQQQVDQAALSASQQAAANPMPVQAYKPGTGGRVVAVAHNVIGSPYVWGAEGPNSFDCSGLYDYALNKAGIHVPRLTAAGYYARSAHVGANALRPGDAVYFSYGSGIDHMGIYAGNGYMIVAPHSGATVTYMRVDWSHFVGGGRIGHT